MIERQYSGAVEATKELRNRSKPISSRVQFASRILEGQVDVVLPRKQTVILEWLLDMLAIDRPAKSSTELWTLIGQVWPNTPRDARSRILKNHKFAASVSEALASKSTDIIDPLTRVLSMVTQETQLLATAQDSQARQLVLAFLNNEQARHNDTLGSIVYEAMGTQVRIFGKSDHSVISSIFNEPVRERELHYLVDYVSTPTNSVVPPKSFDKSLKVLVTAVCTANINIKERALQLGAAFPDRISEIVETIHAERPNEVNAELLNEFVIKSFALSYTDWGFITKCLEINPAPLLAVEANRKRILVPSCPDSIMALAISKSTHLRMFSDILDAWEPQSPVSPVIVEAFCQAMDTLTPIQVANLLENIPYSTRSEMLELVVSSLNYQLANSPIVMQKLAFLLAEGGVTPSTKKKILDLLPHVKLTKINKRSDPALALRAVEVDQDLSDVVPSLLKRVDDGDDLLLRYFPLLEHYADKKRLLRLMKHVSANARYRLALSARAMECTKVTEALIQATLDSRDLHILSAIPKQAYSWNERHSAVSIALKSKHSSFSEMADVVVKLIDSQNLPEPKDMGRCISSAKPTDCDINLIAQMIQPLRRNRSYIDAVINAAALEWQKLLIECHLTEIDGRFLVKVERWLEEAAVEEYSFEITVSMLTLLPQSPGIRKIVQRLTMMSASKRQCVPLKLFKLLCSHNYSWPVVSALFLLTNDAEKEYANYCKQVLSPEQFDLLVFTAADEVQLPVLRALVSQRLMPANLIYQRAITVVISKAANDEAPVSDEFWALCDTVLREKPALLSQFAAETLLEFVSLYSNRQNWDDVALLTSRILLFKRQATRKRLHLVISSLTQLLKNISSADQARTFSRLVDNLCNPPYTGAKFATDREELTSRVAKERRHVAKHAGVLIQDIILLMLQNANSYDDWSAVSSALRPALFSLVDLIFGSGLKAVSAGMDNASRAYLRSVFEDYKLHSRWVSD